MMEGRGLLLVGGLTEEGERRRAGVMAPSILEMTSPHLTLAHLRLLVTLGLF